MKATDHELQQMFKTHQEHSVAAACRAIYDAGIVKGMEITTGELISAYIAGKSPEPVEQGVPDAEGSMVPVADAGAQGQADVTAMVNHLLAVAHMVDAGPHDNWR